MESGGRITGDASNLSNIMSQYTSSVEGVTGVWTGKSHDQFEIMTSEFSGSYPNTVNDQLTAFASACDNYTKYEKLKNDLKQMEATKSGMTSDDPNLATINREISDTQNEINSLKTQIESDLSSAGGSKLEATALTGSVAASLGGTTTSANGTAGSLAGQDPNLIYTADGYVFPFANGIDAPVTSSVGPRDQPTAGASTNHKGTDIGVPEGTEVHSMSSGVVTNAGRDDAGGFGNWVRVEHDDGTVAIYGHVSKSDFYNVGDRVNAGDVVALTGNEGVSTGPHLHLQIETTDGTVLNSENIFDGYWPA